MDTSTYRIENFEHDNQQLEQYLSEAITRYGIDQLKGESPRKQYYSLKNHENIIVGGIMGYATLNMFFISHLYVNESVRNQGLGQKLLIAIENSATKLGCNLLRLNTLNEQTGNLYARAGFKETIRINNYMNGFDLVYYHKPIGIL